MPGSNLIQRRVVGVLQHVRHGGAHIVRPRLCRRLLDPRVTIRRAGNLDFDAVVNELPMRRIGRAEDIAAMALFLASPAAGYVTAQTIHVNGGLWS